MSNPNSKPNWLTLYTAEKRSKENLKTQPKKQYGNNNFSNAGSFKTAADANFSSAKKQKTNDDMKRNMQTGSKKIWDDAKIPNHSIGEKFPFVDTENSYPSKHAQDDSKKLKRALPSSFNLEIDEPLPEPIILSPEQSKILSQVRNGKNIFFTGSAGTGKTFLLREIVSDLKRSYRDDELAVTASTGIAACNINGCTLHSFGGVGMLRLRREEWSKYNCRSVNPI